MDDGSETARAEIIKMIKNAEIPDKINSLLSPWKGIIEFCLIADPVKRIKTIEEVKKKVDLDKGHTILDPPRPDQIGSLPQRPDPQRGG